MFATRPLLFLAIIGLAACQLKKTDCMDDLWKEGKISLDMITVSSHNANKAQLSPDGLGWCGDNTSTNNRIEIVFAEPTIVHEIQIMNSVGKGNVRQIQLLTTFDQHSAWDQLVPTFDTQLHNHSASILDVGGSNLIKMRINIISFDNSPCMRLKLSGCSPKDICPACQNGGQCLQNAVCKCPYGFTGHLCETETSKPPANACTVRQGLGDNSLSSDHLRVSSSDNNQTKDMGRLNYCCKGDVIGGWCPAHTDLTPWYEVMFPSPMAFGGLEIQPPSMLGVRTPPAFFMKSFRLEIILSEDSLKQWRVVAPTIDAISNSTIGKSWLRVNPHVAIDALKIYPLTSKIYPCFRFDVLGCEPSELCSTGFCKNGGTCVGQGQCACTHGFYGSDCSVTTLTTTVFEITTIIKQVIHTTTTLTFNIHGHVSLVTSSVGQAMHVTGTNSYVTVSNAVFPSCLKDIRSCTSGFTIKLNVMFNKLEENTYIISNGGDRPDGMGLALYYASKQLHYIVTTDTFIWSLKTTTSLVIDVWQHLEISWSSSLGIELLNNGKLIGSITRPQPRPTAPKIIPRELTLGYGYVSTSTEVSLTFNGLKTYDSKRTDLVNQGVITVPTTTTSTAKPTKPSSGLIQEKFEFQSIVGNVIQTTSSLTLNIHGHVTLSTSQSGGKAVMLHGTNSYVTIDNRTFQSCLKYIDTCSHGFSLSVVVLIKQLENNTYFLSNGGDLDRGMGVALLYINNNIKLVISTSSQIWNIEAKSFLKTNVMYRMEISWSKAIGSKLYINGLLIGEAMGSIRVTPGKSVNTLAIGYGFSSVHTTVSMEISRLLIVDYERSYLVQQGIWTTMTTKPNTTPIAVSTPASTAVTTKSTIQSLNFTFILIKDNLLVTPLHNFTVYGKPSIVPEVNGSAILVLNKTGQYVELPNTGMQCLQDLTTCDNGFTLSVEIKFLNSSITDKQYIFSSGGDQLNTSGIALYLWKGELYCSVKWNKILWASKSKIHFSHTEWHTYQVSWNDVDGFIVYIDGQLFMNHTLKLPNPTQPDVHSLLIAKGHGSSSTTFLDIRNLFAWTASRDVLIHEHIIQDYTTIKPTSTKTEPPTAAPTTQTTKAPTTTTKAPTTTTKNPTTTSAKSIVSYNWSFTQISQTNLITSENITLHLHGGATVDPNKAALHITQSTHYIDFGVHKDTCLGNLDLCQSGITFEVEVAFGSLQENTIIMSSGGERTDGTGIALVYRFGQIQCVVSTSTVSWYASVPRDKLTISSFNSIVVSWALDKGLILYVDKQIADFSTTQISHQVVVSSTQHLYVGQPPTVSSTTQVDFYLKSIHCWQVWIDIIIDIDIIIGFPPSKVTTTRKPVTTRATTPTTKKVPTTFPPPASTTDVCNKGWICKDDITTPKPTTTKNPTTAKPTTTPKATTEATTTLKTTTPRTTTPRPTKPGLPIYSVHPHIRPGVDGQGSAFFTCSFEKSYQENVEFIVCLNINGNCELMNIVSGLTDSYRFTVASINDNLYNKKVTCSIQARYKGQSGLTGKLTSTTFIPTIKLITTSTLVLTEGRSPQYVTVNSTAPPQMFCCPGCKGQCTIVIQTHTDYDRRDKKCGQLVLPQVIIGWKGPSQTTKAESCGASLSQSNWQGLIQIPITAMVDNLYDRDHSTHVTIQALVTFPRQPPIVTSTSLTLHIGRINAVAKDNDHKSMCTSLNDPHITTFDGRRYDNFNTGEFVLYRHKTLPYEVRAQYQKCSTRRHSNPSCNCAVAIKSGDDVITFSSCGSHGVMATPPHGHHGHDRHHHHQPAPTPITIQMFKNGKLTPGTVIRRLGCGQKYEVHLPTGTVVTIQSSARPFLNIWVKPSSLDYSNTEGLCGVYDRNRGNDVLDNRGRPIPDRNRHPDEFSMKWHVSSGASIFTGVPAATVPGITRFCSCVHGRPVFCVNSHGTMRCLETRYDITRTIESQAKLPQLGGRGRGKRQASISPVTPEVLPQNTLNYTLDEAKDVCTNAIYNNSVTVQCDSVVNGSDISERIDNCAADLYSTGDDVWALDSIKDIMEECLGEVDKTPVNGSNSSVPVIDTSSLCSEVCQNGNCTQGVCQCEPGFAGTDCSVSARNTTPTVNPMPVNNVGCDVRHSSDRCQTVMILGQNFVESPTLTCHYTYIKVTTSVELTGLETKVPANFTNMYQVSCRLPDANTGAFIRVSNDGVTSSTNQYLHLVFDSICYECSIANDTSASTCSRKGDSCVIDQACYGKDETKPGEKYQVCKPDKSESAWTDTCNSDPTCSPSVQASKQDEDETFDQTEIIILAVVCGVLGFCLLVAIGYIVKNRTKGQNHKKYTVHEETTEKVPEVAYDNKMYADENYRM